MIFRAELAEKVLRGEKTQTRRPMSRNPRSPWWYGRCAIVPGRDYALQPGRGVPSIGRIDVTAVRSEALGLITTEDARAEGFPSRVDFMGYWLSMHGHWDDELRVWVVAFKLAA